MLHLYNRDRPPKAGFILTYPTGLEFCLLLLLTAERLRGVVTSLCSSDLLPSPPNHPLSAAQSMICCCLPPPLRCQGLLRTARCRPVLQLPRGNTAFVGKTAWFQATTPSERCRTCRALADK